ncbi:MAG: hypothetical protein QXU09_02020 [Thermoproteota archaeon]|nr:hypothetical protein [Candidatus Brockarchaeota archaeon]
MVKTTIDVDDELWKRFSIAVIGKKGYRKKNEIIEQLIKEYLETEGSYDVSEEALAFEKEKTAFEKMLEKLYKDDSLRGKYVAVLNGRVIDSDYDKLKLVERTYKKYGYSPIFFGFVGQKRVIEIPSPELVRNEV